MRLPAIIIASLVALLPAAARADMLVVKDPDKWIENALHQISEGKIADFARDYVKIIDKPNDLDKLFDNSYDFVNVVDQPIDFDSFPSNLRVLIHWGRPSFVEKVRDVKYGAVLREVIYVALYHETDYMYFKFIVKKNENGWLISNFKLQSEAADLFPKVFVTPQ